MHIFASIHQLQSTIKKIYPLTDLCTDATRWKGPGGPIPLEKNGKNRILRIRQYFSDDGSTYHWRCPYSELWKVRCWSDPLTCSETPFQSCKHIQTLAWIYLVPYFPHPPLVFESPTLFKQGKHMYVYVYECNQYLGCNSFLIRRLQFSCRMFSQRPE